MTPADLYRECRASAWRVEALQSYAGTGDEERQRAFHAGDPLPPPGPGKQADLALIRQLRDAGREVGRVHVVDRPLSPYVRYELAVYAADNAPAGEEIWIADRSAHPELAEVDGDFAVFDAVLPGAAAALFDFDASGAVRGYRITRDAATVRRCRRLLDLAMWYAVPLRESGAIAAA